MISPNFIKQSSSPNLEPHQAGLEIIIGSEMSRVQPNKLWIYGVYQIPEEDALHINASPLHKALVLTATSGSLNMTRNLIGETILLDDDESTSNHLCKGYFNYDLTDWLNVYHAKNYYITISLGLFLSNTLYISVRPISVS